MTTTPNGSTPRTAAALASRLRNSQAALDRVTDAISRLNREKTPVSIAAIARRAQVSRTFLYDNTDARTAVAAAVANAGDRRQLAADHDNQQEASWREHALNAEDALKAANAEILAPSPSAAASANSWDRSATYKPSGPRRTPSASSPRTPPSNSASGSFRPTTASSTNASRPPAPTCGSKTGASPTSKPKSPTPPAGTPDPESLARQAMACPRSTVDRPFARNHPNERQPPPRHHHRGHVIYA